MAAWPTSRPFRSGPARRRRLLALLAFVAMSWACAADGVVGIGVGERGAVLRRIAGGLVQQVQVAVEGSGDDYLLTVRSTLLNAGALPARVIIAGCDLPVESDLPIRLLVPSTPCLGLPRSVDLLPGVEDVRVRQALVARATVTGAHVVRVQHLFEPSVLAGLRFEIR